MLGQDKRELGALLIADEDALLAEGVVAGDAGADGDGAAAADAADDARVEAVIVAEAARALAAARPDARAEERVARFAVVRRRPLSADDGTLTRTLKPRRAAIVEREAAAVAALMAQLRG